MIMSDDAAILRGAQARAPQDDVECSVRRQVPATKNDASRVWIFSAISLAARSSASRKARARAKRCRLPGMSYDTREKVVPVMTDLLVARSIRLYWASMP